MYESFYKLNKKPFGLLPDPDFLFMSETYDNVYSHLEDAIAETKEFVVITGEYGSGKTTLINYFLNNIQQNIKVGLINEIHSPVDQLTKLICEKFGLNVEGKSSMGMLDYFHGFLLKQYEIEQPVALIVDDAQNLSPEAMEEIRVISDLESEELHLIQVILVGQPELKYMLRRKDLDQLAQRITLNCRLNRLSLAETEQYIRYRLNVAGAEDTDIFDEQAIGAIYRYANGIPRLINVICDTALLDGFAENVKQVNRAIIEDVVSENDENGISSDTAQEESPDNSITPVENQVSSQAEDMPRNTEGRISRLEDLTENIHSKLDTLIKRKDSRDRTIVELNKMLMDSLKRHANTLKQFRDFREKINQEAKLRMKSAQDRISPAGVAVNVGTKSALEKKPARNPRKK